MRSVFDKLSKRVWCSIVGVVLLVFIGGVYYQTVYKATPEYSLRVIYEAIQNGDTETFYKYVEGEKILHKIFDPAIEKINRTNPKEGSKEWRDKKLLEVLLANALKNYKPEIDDILAKRNLENWRNRTSRPDLFLEPMISLTEKGRYKLNRIEKSEEVDGVVNVVVFALDTMTNEEKSINLEMTRMDDNTWHITYYDYKKYGFVEDGFDRI